MELTQIPLSKIASSSIASQLTRRKFLHKDKAKELADSVREKGVLQPILVRPSPTNGGFEIIAGERRVQASKDAGLKEVPAIVRELDDKQTLEFQIIENSHREDSHPIAEAEGFQILVDTHGYTPKDIAAKTGMSVRHIYNRLKLNNLAKEVRDAWFDDKITASAAGEIATIGNHGHQAKALEWVLEQSKWRNGEPLSFSRVQEHVRDHYRLKLSDAPFPTDDAFLVPLAGACINCPKNTANQRELFPDATAKGLCTDPKCFADKKGAWFKLQKAKASADGIKVIGGAEAKKIQSPWSSQLAGGYVRNSDKCDADPKKRTYAQLVGDAAKPELLQSPETGKLSRVYNLDAIRPVLEKKGIKLAKEQHRVASTQSAASRAKYEAQQQKRERERCALFVAVMGKIPAALDREQLLFLVDRQNQYYVEGDETGAAVTKAVGVKPGSHTDRKRLSGKSAKELTRILFGMELANEIDCRYGFDHLEHLARCYKINVAAVTKAAAAPAAKPAAKASAKKPAKKK